MENYSDRYGKCWNSKKVFDEEHNKSRENMTMPIDSCNKYVNGSYILDHDTCGNIDMNMVCQQKLRKCRCREGMQWNEATDECQIYMVRSSLFKMGPSIINSQFQYVDCSSTVGASNYKVTFIEKDNPSNDTAPILSDITLDKVRVVFKQ